MPEYLGTGFAELVLAVEERSDAKDLVVRWRRFQLEPPREEEPEPQIKVLLEDIEALELAYFGTPGPDEPSDWWEAWEGQIELLHLIQI